MKCACGCNILSSVAVVAGLAAVGLGGYNFITTGCPLGSCGPRQQAAIPAVTVPVSASVEKTIGPKADATKVDPAPALAVKPGT